MIPLLALIGLVLVAGCWLGWQLIRQNGRILMRLDELEKRLDESEFGGADEPESLPVGKDAPAFELPDLAGEQRTLDHYRGQSLLLIFFNPACGYCRDLAPRLAALATSETPHPVPVPVGRGEGGRSPGEGNSEVRPVLLIITTGDAEMNRQFFSEHKLTCPVLLQKDMEVATAYQANGTPTGYLIGAEGKIASELAVGADALLALAAAKSEIRNPKSEIDESLVSSAAKSRFSNRSLARSKIKRDGLKARTLAPDFRLPRLDGRGEISLEELRGKRVLLIFSDPHCGPCQALTPQVEKFHRENPEIQVVMISRGDPKENRAKVKEHGLTFPVVLQRQWEISRLYAMFATPVAYLIDEAGVIVRDVAVGVDQIVNLTAYAEAAAPPSHAAPV